MERDERPEGVCSKEMQEVTYFAAAQGQRQAGASAWARQRRIAFWITPRLRSATGWVLEMYGIE